MFNSAYGGGGEGGREALGDKYFDTLYGLLQYR
jgi:hypothetical protein